MINQVMGVKMVGVNCRGAAPVLNAVMSGEVSVALLVYPLVRIHLDNGKPHALAVTSAKRTSIAPNIPTVQESTGEFEKFFRSEVKRWSELLKEMNLK